VNPDSKDFRAGFAVGFIHEDLPSHWRAENERKASMPHEDNHTRDYWSGYLRGMEFRKLDDDSGDSTR
jgi:hypothetical protein